MKIIVLSGIKNLDKNVLHIQSKYRTYIHTRTHDRCIIHTNKSCTTHP